MTTKLYSTRIDVELGAVGQPNFVAYLDGVPFTYSRQLQDTTTFRVSRDLAAGRHVLEIKHQHKEPHDPSTALIVKSIQLNGIVSDQFVWHGVYTPEYPEPWATEQRVQGIDLAAALPGNNYLGWNGTWRLEFTTPVFTWIHGVENLGWIYS